jgi:hypothetical protein
MIPNPKNDPDYGRFSMSPPDEVPAKCYWCDECLDDDPVMYDGKPHHADCALENEQNDKAPF